jgi:hypothetical protein
MKRNKKVRINPLTNAPYHVPVKASATLNLRIYPALKSAIRDIAERNDISMTKFLLHIINCYFVNEIPKKIVDDIKRKTKSKGNINTRWDGEQRIWEFI